jgi:hypothetical protein
VKENEVGGPCSANGGEEDRAYVIGRIARRKKPIGRIRRRWVDNIKMDPVEIGLGGVDWIGVAQDEDNWRAVVNAVINLRVP